MKGECNNLSSEENHDKMLEKNKTISKGQMRALISMLLLGAFCLYLLATRKPLDSTLYPVVGISNGARIQLKNIATGNFVRVPSSAEVKRRRLTSSSNDEDDASPLILDQSSGWLHGSSFIVEESGECFTLRSTNGKYLGVDRRTGELRTRASRRLFADAFAAVSQGPALMESPPDSPYSNYRRKLHVQSPQHDGGKGSMSSADGTVNIKVCQENLWLTTGLGIESHTPIFSLVVQPDLYQAAFESSSAFSRVGVEGSYSLRGGSSRALVGAGGSSFLLKEVPQLKGVNLGGLFIPEVWMNPSFYNGTIVDGQMLDQPLNKQGQPLGWAGSLCRMVDWNRKETERRMLERLDSWLTEQDFKEIAAAGFNSVRLPLGYWNVMKDPHNAYAPADYIQSRDKVDWVFKMATKYELLVLLDMHGAPGSQNGQDHSGCNKATEWDLPENQKLSREAIEAMATRYGNHPNLWGFELLNEPSVSYSQDKHELLAQFYRDGYNIIRKHSDEAIVVFKELFSQLYASWKDEMREPNYYNVVMDWHLYDWQAPYTQEWNYRHVLDAEDWRAQIADFTTKYPIMVGEWCMSTGTYTQAGQSFVTAAVNSFQDTASWFLWNWKVESGLDFQEWDVRLQLKHRKEGKGGLYPLDPVPAFA